MTANEEDSTKLRRKLIEYDLPLAEISEQSAREKNIRHGHPSTLHIWWARRPLAASRATTFAALVDDPGEDQPEERSRLLRLIEQMVPWDAVKDGNSPVIEQARQVVSDQFGDQPPKVLDPFAGGGSIPLEALRLGCETYASDYNPVAVFIEKATLEWPQKYGIDVDVLPEHEPTGDLGDLRRGGQKVNLLSHLVEKWANKVLSEARTEIGHFYPDESGKELVGRRDIQHSEGWIPVGFIWARTIPCQNPSCGAEIPLIRQFWLAKRRKKRVAYRPVVDHDREHVNFELLEGSALRAAQQNGFDPGNGTVSRANAECLVCGQVTKAKQVRELARNGQMGQRMVAVVAHHPDETGKKYRIATSEDESVFGASSEYLLEKLDQWSDVESPLPDEAVPVMSGTFNAPLYGLDQWRKLFNPRQQLALLTFSSRIREVYDAILQDGQRLLGQRGDERGADPEELAKAVLGYLAIILDRLADKNASLVVWDNTRDMPTHVFGRQALPMTWDYAEVNPFSGATGDWTGARDWVVRYIENNNWQPRGRCSVRCASATQLPFSDASLDAVVTDPPYYNSVPYADLSDFFYVWLKRVVGGHFPQLFSTPVSPKGEEITEMAGWDPIRYANKDKGFFERRLALSFQEMYRVLKPGGVSVIVYAHKTTEGWETMLNALVEAGLVVTGSWPVHTEMKSRLRAAQSAALASSIYMVCRKAEREAVGFWDDIRPQVKARVEAKLSQFWKAGIAGGDFFISAIGPGMEAYSRYERVETYEGKPIGVLELLEYIRSVATDFLVHRLLRDASAGAIDRESQFYLTYRWTYLDNRVEFDDARKIASAEGVKLESLWGDGGFIKKTTKYIEVLGPKSRRPVESPANMVDVMHAACQLWEKSRKDELDSLLADTGYGSSNAFWQFCQAVAECLMNGNKEKQLLEGMLLGKEQYGKTESRESNQGSLELE